MAFAYVEKRRYVIGDRWVVEGTFTNGSGDTGGNIVSGLRRVDWVDLQHTGSAVAADSPAVNETMPLETTGTVTIVTTDNADGIYRMIGQQ
jgi:hypothetical protein